MPSHADILAFLERGQELSNLVARTRDDPHVRALLLARHLHGICVSPLTACAVRTQDGAGLCVLDGEGNRREDWQELVRRDLERCTREAEPGRLEWVGAPPVQGLKAQVLAVAPVARKGSRGGCLALALPRSRGSRSVTLSCAFLLHWAEDLAIRFELEQTAPGTPGGHAARLEDFADLAYLMAHEINNLLNNILLQISIVELTAPGKVAAELQPIRQMTGETAAKVHRFQELSRANQPAHQRVDLNAIIRSSAAARVAAHGQVGPASSIPAHLDLAPNLPEVMAAPLDLQRLIQLMLQDADAALQGTGGIITLHTEYASGRVRLVVEDTGPAVPEPLVHRLFEPFESIRPGSDGLRLAVCRAITRRLQGTILAQASADGGLRIIVELPSAW